MDSDRMGAERMDAHPRPGWIWADWIWADRIRTGTLGKASDLPCFRHRSPEPNSVRQRLSDYR